MELRNIDLELPSAVANLNITKTATPINNREIKTSIIIIIIFHSKLWMKKKTKE